MLPVPSYLYTGAAGQNLVSPTPLTYALSPDGKSLEIAIPRSLAHASGRPAPANINIAAELNNPTGNSPGAVYLPGDYTNPEYTITDPATLLAKTTTTRSPSSTRTPAPTSISARPPIPICSWRRRTRRGWPASPMTSSTSRN